MKTRINLFLAIVVLVTGHASFSADIYWLKIKPNFLYKDLSVYCETYGNSNSLFLAMEVSQGKATRAILRKNLSFAWESTEFSQNEVSSLQIKISGQNEASVEEMLLENKNVAWILRNSGGEMGCHPPGPIVSLNPGSFLFKFQGQSPQMFSNTGKFTGKLKNADNFQAELSFGQSQL